MQDGFELVAVLLLGERVVLDAASQAGEGFLDGFLVRRGEHGVDFPVSELDAAGIQDFQANEHFRRSRCRSSPDREAAPAADSISVKVDLMMTKVPLDDILYVKADGDYIVIHKADGKTLMTLMTLKSLEKQLPFDRFCRTHRSWIVNVDKARGIRDGKILVGDAVIPLSDSCKAAFFELLSHKSIFLKAEPTVLKEK